MDIEYNVHPALKIVVDNISQLAGIFEGYYLPG
jgi:hypothetical protein